MVVSQSQMGRGCRPRTACGVLGAGCRGSMGVGLFFKYVDVFVGALHVVLLADDFFECGGVGGEPSVE